MLASYVEQQVGPRQALRAQAAPGARPGPAGCSACWVQCLLGAVLSGSSVFWEQCFLGAVLSGSSVFWEQCFWVQCFLGAVFSGSSVSGSSAFWEQCFLGAVFSGSSVSGSSALWVPSPRGVMLPSNHISARATFPPGGVCQAVTGAGVCKGRVVGVVVGWMGGAGWGGGGVGAKRPYWQALLASHRRLQTLASTRLPEQPCHP